MTESRVPRPVNEPVLAHAPGSPERAGVDAELAIQAAQSVTLPLVIGGERVLTSDLHAFSAPHRHSLELGRFCNAEPVYVARAIDAALAAKSAWAALDLSERGAVFRRAADLLSGPRRSRLLAATMLNQSKTVHQAEIDAVCELADFFRFNAHFAEELADGPRTHLPTLLISLGEPINPRGFRAPAVILTWGVEATLKCGRLAPSETGLNSGDTLGRFQLLLPIGAGGMGRVWVARELGTGTRPRLLAVKTTLNNESVGAEFWNLLIDEARIASQVQHPNVCSIHAFEVDQSSGVPYLVMTGRTVARSTSFWRCYRSTCSLTLSPRTSSREFATVCTSRTSCLTKLARCSASCTETCPHRIF
jgi:Aldehyde dehydrogenase family